MNERHEQHVEESTRSLRSTWHWLGPQGSHVISIVKVLKTNLPVPLSANVVL